MRAGLKATRTGWNAPGQYVVYQPGYPDGIGINANTAAATGGDLARSNCRDVRPADGVPTSSGAGLGTSEEDRAPVAGQ